MPRRSPARRVLSGIFLQQSLSSQNDMSVNSHRTPYRPAAVAAGVCRSGSARPKAGAKGRRPVRRDTDPAPRTLFRKPLSNGHREGLVAARPEFRPDYLPDFIPYDGLFLQFYNAKFCALVFFHATNLHLPSETPILPLATKPLPEGGVWGGVEPVTGTAGGDNTDRERETVHGINDRS